MPCISAIKETIERRDKSMKQQCAKAAAVLIKDNMIIGLGGGSTVGYLIEEIAQSGKNVQVVTPSMDTEELCRKHGLSVLPLGTVEKVDIAFDGCDELDQDFQALKSCGGIHTREKLVAAMAEQYILLADESKYFATLPFAYPVTIEVLPTARAYVKKQLLSMGAMVTERRCNNKTGLTLTDDGNYLMEAVWEQSIDIGKINQQLDRMVGIVGHGLFYNVVTGAIIVGTDTIQIINK